MVTFPGGSGGWHPITPCPSCKRGRHVLGVDGGCAGAGSAPGPEEPAWAMFRSTQCGVLEAALPRRRPSAGTVALSPGSVHLQSASGVRVPLRPGQVEGGQCCHLLVSARPRVGARVESGGSQLERASAVAAAGGRAPVVSASPSEQRWCRCCGSVLWLAAVPRRREATTRDRAESGVEITSGRLSPRHSGRDGGTCPGGSWEQWPMRAWHTLLVLGG